MDAEQLYRVMEKVPREAWGCAWRKPFGDDPGGWVSANHPYHLLSDDVAENAHVGAMLKWIAPRHKWRTEIVPPELQDDDMPVWSVGWPGDWHDAKRGISTRRGEAMELVEALAHACAAVPAPGGEGEA